MIMSDGYVSCVMIAIAKVTCSHEWVNLKIWPPNKEGVEMATKCRNYRFFLSRLFHLLEESVLPEVSEGLLYSPMSGVYLKVTFINEYSF